MKEFIKEGSFRMENGENSKDFPYPAIFFANPDAKKKKTSKKSSKEQRAQKRGKYLAKKAYLAERFEKKAIEESKTNIKKTAMADQQRDDSNGPDNE